MSKFKKEIFEVARNTEQSFDTVSTAALELSRQGLDAQEVLNRLNDAMILSRLSGLGAAESVAGLTAAINSFKKEGITSYSKRDYRTEGMRLLTDFPVAT